MMKRTRYYSAVFAALLPVVALSAAQGGCKKDEDETKPMASVTAPPIPTPPPTPSAPATIVPEEDAGPDAADASDAKAPVTGTGTSSASATIAKCCAALQQNANSAPPEQKGAYQAAATACNGLKSMPAAQQAFSQIRAFLAGAKMPAACQ